MTEEVRLIARTINLKLISALLGFCHNIPCQPRHTEDKVPIRTID
ncbi:hypothetical protein BofuT4_uP072010.1 [Botrytis cinerea T4]|uniref:Uncharacterized protein n=1 Tax=Botryotinia fuckeliana (strain T4) TaxID=999810 RepID=G2XQ17_BOTF4|nr:hypothetical protein BofuT4_uP072010.1 [Botrytis cinerea T4]